jgi:uroporphyrinogen-III decarboxylase
MKTNRELLAARKTRIMKAIALEKPDKTPCVLMGDAFFARTMGVQLSDFCSDFQTASNVTLECCKTLGDFEGLNSAYPAALIFPMIFMSRVKMPGKELPPDSLWQLDEKEVITLEDYDTILKIGWGPFMADVLKNRLHFPLEETLAQLAETPKLVKNFEDAGFVIYASIVATAVPELLGGGRSMPKYNRDLYRIPDKVEAVLDVIQQESLETLRKRIRATKASVVFLSPARGASEFYAPRLWERFVWKYLKESADAIIEEGACVDIHIDANWELGARPGVLPFSAQR